MSLVLHVQIGEGGGKGGGGLRESLGAEAKCQRANTLRMTTMMCSCSLFIFVFSRVVMGICLAVSVVH